MKKWGKSCFQDSEEKLCCEEDGFGWKRIWREDDVARLSGLLAKS